MFKTRKCKYLIIVLLAVIMALCLVLSSCNILAQLLHKHSYDDQWYSDESYHWQQCTGCSEPTLKSKHTVDESSWQIISPATETQMGARKGTCSVCNAEVLENIPKIEHQHAFDGEYMSDNVGHWKECSCGEKSGFAVHSVASWTIDVDATQTAPGQKSGQCDVCHKNVTEQIPIVGHTHNYSQTLSHDDNYHYYECSGCDATTEKQQHVYSSSWQSDETSHWKECVCGKIDSEQPHVKTWIVDNPATTTSTGSKHEECTTCHKTFGTEVIDKLTSSTRTVDFYAINDFHGEVDKISSIGGYLKERKNDNANTVLINSGDMFQGSMESNSNYGKLLTDCMDAIGFDAFTFGNHEFDWGLGKLEALAQNSNVPFLGANIYHWDAETKTWGTFASELAQKYTVKLLDNGLKVGIIGVIGKDQITSISSNLVQTIGFKDPLPIIKEVATELRDEQGCDIVVVSAHTGPQSLVGETENNAAPSSAGGLQNYVDAVFCAHTHRAQNYLVDGLPFIQGGSYGTNVSRISLSINANGDVSYTRENIAYSNSWPNIMAVDTLIDNSNAQIADERNQVLIPNLSNSLNSNPAMARLVSRSIAEYAKHKGYNIALAMVNTARKTLPSGKVTYSDLYESIPFDNVVYIAKVKGSEIINEVKYGNYYWRSSGEAIESDNWYTIAVIDYLLFHQSASRNYNYFPSAFTSGFTPVALTNENYDVYNYRFITRDYLLSNSINASDYLYDNSNTDTSLLESSVTLDYQTIGNWTTSGGGTTPEPTPVPTTTHAGTLADPYSVADALKKAAEYSSSSNAGSGYIVGKVSVDGSRLRRGSGSDDLGGIYLVDDDGNELLVYWLSKFNGATVGDNWDWSNAGSTVVLPNDLNEGDTIIIYAKTLFTYNTNILEVGSGYCVSINGEPTN